MYDAIVIGSRCAGAPTAMLLARRGRRVLVVDRATFPSDVLSGHTIQPAGIARLRRWGLLDRVRATGVPFLDAVRFDFGPVVLEGEPAPIDGITDTVCIRRTVLDTLLTDAAAEAGAEVRHGFTVKELLWEGGRVVGIRGRDATGATVEERAAIVIGADGANSFVARPWARRPTGACRPPRSPSTPTGGASTSTRVELYTRPGRFVVALPTNDDLVIVVQIVPADEAALPGPHRGRLRRDAGRGAPPRRPGGTPAERVERFRGRPSADGFFRQAGGPGWALVGDAGYHKDPITAQGMLDAFRDAELLADAVDRGLDGDLAAELAGYQQARDEAALPMYELTCGLAEIEAPHRRDARARRRPRPATPPRSPGSSG